MNNLLQKIVLVLLIASILLVVILSVIVFKQNKEIKSKNIEIQNYLSQKDEMKVKISKLEKELKEWKDKKDYYHEIFEDMQKCQKDAHYSIDSMFYCIDEASTKWEKTLNKNMAELEKVLTPTQYKALLNSQNKWMNYKKAEIEFLKATYGASMGVYFQNQVNINTAIINEQRARDLNEILNFVKEGTFILP